MTSFSSPHSATPGADSPSELLAPNHHAHHRGFSGLRGWIAAQSMRVGRNGDADLAIELTNQQVGDRVVDIGCGSGVAARRSAAAGGIVTGVDPAEMMIDMARRADSGGDVTWRLGGAEQLPLPDASHDIAWSLASVHHWPDLDRGLAEVQRVLGPDGQFLAMERLTKPGATGLASHGWTPAQAARFAEMCEHAGFSSLQVSTHATGRRRVIAVLATTSRARSG